jgi:tetratricopeptide (TPR) repeat protein
MRYFSTCKKVLLKKGEPDSFTPMNERKGLRGWAIAGAVVIFVCLVAGMFIATRISRIKGIYHSFYEVQDQSVQWTTQGRAWWEFRSQRNRWRAEYLLGRKLPPWGYVVQTKWFSGATLVLSWDPHDNSKVVVYRPNPQRPLSFTSVLSQIAVQERNDFWGIRLRRWFGEPPPIWTTLRCEPDVSPRIVSVRLPDQDPPAQGFLSNVLVSSETWTVLAFPDSKGQLNRLNVFIKGLSQKPTRQENLQLYDNIARFRPTGAGDVTETAFLDMSFGHWGQAFYYWHRRSLENRQDFEFYRLFGNDMRMKGLLKQAVYGFGKALQNNPQDPFIWKNFGDTLMLAKKYTIAIPVYRQLVKLRPRSADARAKLAHAYDRVGRLEPAMQSYGEALKLEPDNYKAWEGLAHVAIETGHPKEGAAYAFRAIKIHPAADSFEDLCAGAIALKKFKDALNACQQSLSLEPRRATAYSTLGILYFNMRKLPESLAAFQKSDQLGRPTTANLGFEGIILTQLNRLKEAAAALEHAVALSPQDGKLHGLLSQVYAEMGNRAGVEQEQKILSGLNPLPGAERAPRSR